MDIATTAAKPEWLGKKIGVVVVQILTDWLVSLFSLKSRRSPVYFFFFFFLIKIISDRQVLEKCIARNERMKKIVTNPVIIIIVILPTF